MSKMITIGLMLIMALMGCRSNSMGGDTVKYEKKVLTIKDISYRKNDKSVNSLYIHENGTLVPFLILDGTYDSGAAILLRRDVMVTPRRFNDYSSYYDSSEIDRFLNDEYIYQLGDMEEYLVPVSVEIASEDSLGLAGDNTLKITRKSFLLSYTEVGLLPSPTTAVEGKALDYFTKNENRIACDEDTNEPGSWFLRSPNAYFNSAVYSIGPAGDIGTGNANEENGIRPAICIKSDTNVEKIDNIPNDDHAYIISSN